MRVPETTVRLDPWAAGDLPLLEKLTGDAAMMEHLGGPETRAKIAERQARYEPADSGMFKIVADGESVGSVGFWPRTWGGEEVNEIGWSVLPAFQGRGIARMATALAVELARAEGTRRFLHAFPSVENQPSNGICRTLGFTLLGACEFEFPPGHLMRCNDWRLDLFSSE